MTVPDRLIHALRLVLTLVLAGSLAACATTDTGLFVDPVPAHLVLDAHVPGATSPIRPIRYWGDITGSGEDRGHIEAVIRRQLPQIAKAGTLNYLALSGGGFNGAFGVGYLLGWTARGDRPRFQIVTGISVGALIAPFAFLGSSYDSSLEAAYRKLVDESERSSGNALGLLFGAQSFESNKPVADAVAAIITTETLAAIGAEYKKGRRLLIGTTDLDAQRPVVWDIGAIALSDIPDKVDLVRRILLASAAVPGIYPPVPIEVVANGHPYREIHVDGGVTREVVLVPDHHYAQDLRVPLKAHIFVLYNGQLSPAYAPVKLNFPDIMLRSLPTLLKYQGLANISLLRQAARTNGADFKLAAIPGDFAVAYKFPPDPDYLDKLIALGNKMGRSGDWQK